MGSTWQRVRLKIPDNIKPTDRKRLAASVIEYIVTRTKKGLDKNEKPFAPYSKEYIRSLDFKIAGKNKNKVNLTLSGDMLASISLISHNKNSLLIGMPRNSEENDKADGNIKGTYGNPAPVTKPRDFLGIRPSILNKLAKNYKPKPSIIKNAIKTAVLEETKK